MSNVLAVGPLPPPINGSSLAFLESTTGLEEASCDLSVIDISSAVADRGGRPTFQRALEYVRILVKMVETLIKKRPEALYLHAASSLHGLFRDAVVVSLARIAGVNRMVLHFQSGNVGELAERGLFTRAIMRRVYRRADVLLTLADELRQMFSFDPSLGARVRVVPNCGPVVADRESQGKTLGIPVRVLFLSNLIESKGWLTLLRAIPDMRESASRAGRDLKVTFAGQFLTNTDDTEVQSAEHAREIFDRTLRDFGLEEVVEYRGLVYGSDKNSLLRDAHIFVLPTRYNKEAQPLSIAEAMGSGAVVISSKYRGIPALVSDGVSGILVEEPTVASIAASFERLMDPDVYSRMSSEALARYRESFSPSAYRHRIREIVLG